MVDIDEIEQKYTEGDYDACLALVDKKFTLLRNYFSTQQQGKSLF
jgi:hypothetical protein